MSWQLMLHMKAYNILRSTTCWYINIIKKKKHNIHNGTTSSWLPTIKSVHIRVHWVIGYFLDPPLPLHDHNHQHICLLQHPILLLLLQ